MSNSPLNVLVVDDEDIIRYLCTSALSEAGHSSIAVEDGSSALKALDKERFDSILLDMAFVGPPMGRELYERIIAEHPFMKGRIAIITGILARKDIEKFQNDGVPVLEKPFELTDMIATVNGFGPVGEQ